MAMRFEVPQFIDVEDKIFGPFTLKQFIFMAGGAGFAFIAYRFIPGVIRWAVAAIPLVVGLSLAFFKINGRPFIFTFQNFFTFLFSNKLYIWHLRQMSASEQKSEEKSRTAKQEKRLAEQRAKLDSKSTDMSGLPGQLQDGVFSDRELHDLAWNLDILESKRKGQS